MIEPSISRLVAEAASAAARRARDLDLDNLWQRFVAAATSQAFLDRLPSARSHRWAGAIPTHEHPGAVFTTSAWPADVVGVDGSQVYPQDRSPVLWAYVQAVAYRKGYAPDLLSQFFDIGTRRLEDDVLADNMDELTAMTNTWRTMLEMRCIRSAAQMHPGCLILMDNGLLPWLSVTGQASQQYLHEYLEHLRSIAPGLVTGVISGPQSRLFERLVHLAEADTIEDGIQDRREFLDQSLMFHVLKPGERSALFMHGSPRNDRFREVGAGVFFFFLRTGEREIVRVEIPEWIAAAPDLVSQVQASVLADAVVSGYSYVLSQAHQHAVVPATVGQTLQASAESQYIQMTGRVQAGSGKLLMKTG